MDHNAKKRLLLMLPMLHQGGFERVAVATARLLAEDYDVALCVFSDQNIHYDVSGLRIINLDVPSRKGKLRKVLGALARARLARRVKGGFDLCYSFGSTANLVNILSPRRGCATVTGMRCGTDLEEGLRTKACIHGAALTIACSRELEALMRGNLGARRTAFLYNPLDVEDIRARAGEREVPREPGTFVLATMGRDDRIKAHWHLLKAFAIAARDCPGLRLRIIGAGKYTAYRKLAEALGVGDRVTFTGALRNPFPEVAEADLYVLPSNHEGFPNALVEAMALGRPVIATDCRSGPREILLSEEELERLLAQAPYGVSTRETIRGKYGILIPDMSPEINTDPGVTEAGERVLAEEILGMVRDSAARAHYAAQSLRRVSDYTPESYRRRLREILERCGRTYQESRI